MIIYATRIGRDGQPVDRGGRRIAENVSYPPVIASNGSEYLVCYQTGNRLVAQRLDENAAPIARPTDLDVGHGVKPFSLTSNGSGYLLLFGSDSTVKLVMLLDKSGARTVVDMFGKMKAIGVRNGNYEVIQLIDVALDLLYVRFVLHTITPAGIVTDRELPTITFTRSVDHVRYVTRCDPHWLGSV